jgi:hypothetical protein
MPMWQQLIDAVAQSCAGSKVSKAISMPRSAPTSKCWKTRG